MLLKVPWGRGPGAGVADAKVDSLAVLLHVESLSKTLAAVGALVRPSHLMDRLDVPGEIALLNEGFAAGRTFEVLNLGVNGSHVVHHTLVSFTSRENLIANGA